MKKIMAMIGSLSARSANRTVVEHIAKISSGKLSIEIYDGIRNLPQFNPDLETETPPAEVAELRQTIREADARLRNGAGAAKSLNGDSPRSSC